MRLHQAHVRNFRSIVDSGPVILEDRVTVIVGKNEQGKTNFLRALESFDRSHTYTANELPNHLRPALEAKDPKSIPIVTLRFVPDPADQLKEVFPDIESIKCFEITRFFDGHYEYKRIEDQQGMGEVASQLTFLQPEIKPLVEDLNRYAENLRTKLTTHSTRFPAFAPSLGQAGSHIDQFVEADFTDYAGIDNLIKTFVTALKGLPNQDQAIQEDVATTTREIQAKQLEIQQLLTKRSMSSFERRIPRILFHSSILDKIPNEVDTPAFIVDPERTSRGMANLCGVAGLSTQKIKELASAPTTARETYEDNYRASVSGGINEFWTQEKYDVYFRIEPQKLSVSISDHSYARRIAPSERSEGFQWYLSFYCAILNEVSATDPTIVLLDNPALELHADGQYDIKRFLEEKLPFSTQVIYATHSPAMIDLFNLKQIRKAELKMDLQGTKVTELNLATEGFDLFEPVRSALGARLVSSLVVNDFNVLVEGAADKPILEGIFGLLHKDIVKRILVNGSVAETKDAFLPRFYERARLPFIVCLDADSRGREIAKSLIEEWKIPAEKIIELGKVISSGELGLEGNEFTLEDLLSNELYHEAVKATYPDLTVDIPKSRKGKRTNYYDTEFKGKHGIGFNKRRVAETVKQMILKNKLDAQSKTHLSTLASAILNALDSQTSSKKTVPKN